MNYHLSWEPRPVNNTAWLTGQADAITWCETYRRVTHDSLNLHIPDYLSYGHDIGDIIVQITNEGTAK